MNTDWIIAGLILTIFGLIAYYYLRDRGQKPGLKSRLKRMTIDHPFTSNRLHPVFVEGQTHRGGGLYVTVRLGNGGRHSQQLRLIDSHSLLIPFEGQWVQIALYDGRLCQNAVVVRAKPVETKTKKD